MICFSIIHLFNGYYGKLLFSLINRPRRKVFVTSGLKILGENITMIKRCNVTHTPFYTCNICEALYYANAIKSKFAPKVGLYSCSDEQTIPCDRCEVIYDRYMLFVLH